MYIVEVKNSCRCMLRSGLSEMMQFQTEEQAKEEAQKMLEKMKNDFCKKHEFSLVEKFGDCTIYIKPRA